MTTQERLYSYGEESSPSQLIAKKRKSSEAIRTYREVSDIVGIRPASVASVETRAIRKIVVGLRDRGCSYTEAILTAQKILGVNDPRTILRCLDEDYIEKTRQYAKKLDISDM